MKYNLKKYTTADEIFNRISSSLKSYVDSDLILFDEYYKVIDLCNSRLGFRINPTKEVFLKIENGRIDLPIDFHLLELALLVGNKKTIYNFGTSKTEYLTSRCPTIEDLAPIEINKCCNFKLECGKVPILTCEYKDHYIEFSETIIAPLTEKKYATNNCFNLNISKGKILMEITNNQIFIDNINEGYVYLQYTSNMSEEGNIPICLDNDIILNYYEQAVKFEILQDLYINKKLEVIQALQLVEKRLILAKNEAISLASTPEFGELQQIGNFLRRQYRKYNPKLR
jgi:hypothetical protein